MASLERHPVLAPVGRRLHRVSVERKAHGLQLAVEGAVLERGEEGVEVGEAGQGAACDDINICKR